MEKEVKIDRETAVAEFERFCEANEIDYDESAMTADELDGFLPLKKRFIKACMDGRVEVDGLNIKYTISQFSEKCAGEVVVIKRPSGKAFMMLNKYTEKQGIGKLQAFLSAMLEDTNFSFALLDSKDLMFLIGIATLFLAE